MSADTRYHALDAVRAVALLSGIALHSTMSFLPGFREANWPISDDSQSLTLSVTFFVIHIFRMSLFFVISGFFARMLMQRLGTRGFARNRLRRIALPFVVAMIVVMPFLLVSFIWGQHVLGMSGAPLLRPGIPDPRLPPWGHLWFLYLLLVLYALWTAGRGALNGVDRRGLFAGLADRTLAATMAVRITPLLFAAPVAALLYTRPWWQAWTGIPTPVMGFVPNFTSVLAFGSAFAFGWFLHRQQTLLETLKRDWLPNLVAACLLSAFALAIVGVTSRFTIIELPGRERLAYAVVYMLACWYWIFGLIGTALRFLAQPSARWRYLADASFFLYLVHLPIVNVLQVWVIRWPVHWALKYLLIVSLTMFVLLAMYEYLVRSTFVGQFLNGRKYPRTMPSITKAPSTSPG